MNILFVVKGNDSCNNKWPYNLPPDMLTIEPRMVSRI